MFKNHQIDNYFNFMEDDIWLNWTHPSWFYLLLLSTFNDYFILYFIRIYNKNSFDLEVYSFDKLYFIGYFIY